MNLNQHYNNLYKKSIAEISSDTYEIDEMIDSKYDNRFGVSLLIRPSETVKFRIQNFINELKAIEPNQYYYPNSDIHITILSIISCYDDFELHTIEPSKYIELIKNHINFSEKTTIQFKGITIANSCVLLKGFTNNDSINTLRKNLRTEFKYSTLEQSLDERYLLQTSHATIVRLREKLTNKDGFLKKIDDFRAFDFGTFEVKAIELTYNDWYHRKERVTKLFEFEAL